MLQRRSGAPEAPPGTAHSAARPRVRFAVATSLTVLLAIASPWPGSAGAADAERASTAGASDTDALIREASLLLAGRKFVGAAELFGQVLVEDESSTVAVEGLGHALAGLGIEAKRQERDGKPERAAELFRRSLELNRGGSDRLDGLRQQAEAELARLAPTPPAKQREPAAATTAAASVAAAATAGGAAAGGAAARAAAGPRSEIVPIDRVEPPRPVEAATPGAVAAAATPVSPPPPSAAPAAPARGGSFQLLEYPQEDFDALLSQGATLLRRGEYVLALDHLNVARRVRPDDGAAKVGYREAIAATSKHIQDLADAGERAAAEQLYLDAREVAPEDESLRSLGTLFVESPAP